MRAISILVISAGKGDYVGAIALRTESPRQARLEDLEARLAFEHLRLAALRRHRCVVNPILTDIAAWTSESVEQLRPPAHGHCLGRNLSYPSIMPECARTLNWKDRR